MGKSVLQNFKFVAGKQEKTWTKRMDARVCHVGALVKTERERATFSTFFVGYRHLKGKMETNLTDSFPTANLQLFPAHHMGSANVMCFLGFVKGDCLRCSMVNHPQATIWENMFQLFHMYFTLFQASKKKIQINWFSCNVVRGNSENSNKSTHHPSIHPSLHPSIAPSIHPSKFSGTFL